MSEFFKNILREGVGCKRITIIIDPTDGGAVVNVIPETGDKSIKERLQAKIISGTIEELDNEFFLHVKREPVKEGLTVADAPEADKEKEEPKPKAKKAAGKGTDKKKAPVKAKPATKKAAAEKPKEEETAEDPEEESAQNQLEF